MSDFLKLTKHHLSAFKVSETCYSCLLEAFMQSIYISVLLCYNYVFLLCIYQEVLSQLIESIKTYVDNLAVLVSRYFNSSSSFSRVL